MAERICLRLIPGLQRTHLRQLQRPGRRLVAHGQRRPHLLQHRRGTEHGECAFRLLLGFTDCGPKENPDGSRQAVSIYSGHEPGEISQDLHQEIDEGSACELAGKGERPKATRARRDDYKIHFAGEKKCGAKVGGKEYWVSSNEDGMGAQIGPRQCAHFKNA